METAVHEMAETVIGQDATRIEHCWQLLFRGFWRGGVVSNSALSGIDQALWDIAGKIYGVPVYKLLGGECRDRIRVYAHGDPSAASDIIAEGYTGVKTGPGPTGNRSDRFVVEQAVIPRSRTATERDSLPAVTPGAGRRPRQSARRERARV